MCLFSHDVSEGNLTEQVKLLSQPPPINSTATLIICGHTWSQRGLWYATNREGKVTLSDVGKSPFSCLGRCFCSAQREAVGRTETDWRNWTESRGGGAVQPEAFHGYTGMSPGNKHINVQFSLGQEQKWALNTHAQSKEKHVFNQASSICQRRVCTYTWPNTPLHRSCHWKNR